MYKDIPENSFLNRNNNVTSPVIKDMLNIMGSMESKEALLKSSMMEKELHFKDYKNVDVFFTDGDSGYYLDESNNRHEFRLADFDYLDAVDKKENVDNSSFKSKTQPMYVSNLVGKRVEMLTDDDYRNVSNYQANELYRSLTEKDYVPNNYDNNTIYEPLVNKSVKLAVKNVGTGMYGRELLDAVNPNTGKSVSYSTMTNPRLNASFDVYKYIETPENLAKLEAYDKKIGNTPVSQIAIANTDKYFQDLRDTDGTIGEWVDIIQSGLYQSYARFAHRFNMPWDTDEDREEYKLIADPELGQALADAWVGVRTDTREEGDESNAKYEKLWEDGHYVDALIEGISNVSYNIVNSAPQMAIQFSGKIVGGVVGGIVGGIGGAVVGGPAGAIAGMGTGGTLGFKYAGSVLGAAFAAGDETLATMEDYKTNNNGKEMSMEDVAYTYIGNLLLFGAEDLLVGKIAKKIFPLNKLKIPGRLVGESAEKAITRTTKEIITGGAKNTGKAFGGEFLQEYSQNIWHEYKAQNQDNTRSLLEIAKDPKMVAAGVQGAISAGVMTGVPTAVSTPLEIAHNKKLQRRIQQRKQHMESTTQLNEDVDTDLSNRYSQALSNINMDEVVQDNDKAIKLFGALHQIRDDSRSSQSLVEQAELRLAELTRRRIEEAKNDSEIEEFLKLTGQTREEALANSIYGSGLDVAGVFERTGGRITDEARENAKKRYENLAKKLGLTSKQAQAIFDGVYIDSAYGPKGYLTYKKDLQNIQKELENTTDTNTIEELKRRKQIINNKLLGFIDSRISNLNKAVSITNDIADGKTRKATFQYGVASYDGKPKTFTIDLDSLIRGETNENNLISSDKAGPRKVIKEWYKTANRLVKIYEKYNETPEAKDRLKEVRKQYKNLVQQFKVIEINTNKEITNNRNKRVVNLVRNVETAKKNLFKLAFNKGTLKNQLDVMAYSLAELQDLRNIIEKNDTLKSPDKRLTNPQTRQKVLQQLDKIIAKKKSISNAEQNIQNRLADVKKLFNTAYINNLNTNERIAEALQTIDDLSEQVKALDNADTELKALDNIRNKIVESQSKNIATSTYESAITLVNHLKKKDLDDETIKNQLLNFIDTTDLNIDSKDTITDILNKLKKKVTDFNSGYGKDLNTQTQSTNQKVYTSTDTDTNINDKQRELEKAIAENNKQVENTESNVEITPEASVDGTIVEGQSVVQNDTLVREEEDSKTELNTKTLEKTLNESVEEEAEVEETIVTLLVNKAQARVLQNYEKRIEERRAKAEEANATPVQKVFRQGRHAILTASKIAPRIKQVLSYVNKKQEQTDKTINSTVDDLILDSVKEMKEEYQSRFNKESIEELSKNPEFKEWYDDFRKKVKEDYNLLNPEKLSRTVTGIDGKPKLQLVLSSLKFFFGERLNKDTNTKETLTNRGLWNTSPWLFLMYDLGVNDKLLNKKDGLPKHFSAKPNAYAFTAMELAITEFIATNMLENSINPTSNEQILQRFGRTEDAMSIDPSIMNTFKQVTKKCGVPRGALATMLGRAVLNQMGLTFNKEANTLNNTYAKIEEGLGNMCIDSLVNRGIITIENYSTTDIARRLIGRIKVDEDVLNEAKEQVKAAITIGDNSKIPLIKPANNSAIDRNTVLMREIFQGNAETGKEGLKNILGLNDNFNKKPYFSTEAPSNANDPSPLLKHSSRGRVPSGSREAQKVIQNTKFNFNTELGEYLLQPDKIDKVKKLLGYVNEEEMRFLHLDAQISAEGKNMGIDRFINNMIEANEIQKSDLNSGFYYKTFVSLNGRIYFDTSALNPQTDKDLGRFLCLPSTVKRVYDLNNVSDNLRRYEAFALSQAFDTKPKNTEESLAILEKFDSLSKEDILQMREDILEYGEDFGKKVWNKKLGIKLGIENLGQVLVTLQHFEKKADAKANGNTSFETWLSTEVDSTTSGYIFRLNYFPDKTIVDKVAHRLGVIHEGSQYDNMPIDYLKKQSGFLDVYQFTASDTMYYLSSILKDLDNKAEVRNIFQSQNKIATESYVLATLFKGLKEYLPVAEKNEDGTWNITSDLRNLMKPPTMVFGYNAGEKSTKKAIAKDITDSFIKDYVKWYQRLNKYKAENYRKALSQYIKANNEQLSDKEIKKIESIFNFVYSLEHNPDIKRVTQPAFSLYKVIMTNSLDKIYFNIPVIVTENGEKISKRHNVSLNTLFNEMIAPTYGNAIWSSLSKSYDNFRPYSKTMNNMFNTMATIERKMAKFMEWYNSKKVNDPSSSLGMFQATYNKMMKDISSMFGPNVGLPYLTSTSDAGINLEREERKAHGDNLVVSFDKNGTLYTTRASGTEITKTKNAGGVIPIHFSDGVVMALTTTIFGGNIIPVHDAVVSSFEDTANLAHVYNGLLYHFCKDYDVFDSTVARTKQVADKFERLVTKPEFKELFDEYNAQVGGRDAMVSLKASLMGNSYETIEIQLASLDKYGKNVVEEKTNIPKEKWSEIIEKGGPQKGILYKEIIKYLKYKNKFNEIGQDVSDNAVLSEGSIYDFIFGGQVNEFGLVDIYSSLDLLNEANKANKLAYYGNSDSSKQINNMSSPDPSVKFYNNQSLAEFVLDSIMQFNPKQRKVIEKLLPVSKDYSSSYLGFVSNAQTNQLLADGLRNTDAVISIMDKLENLTNNKTSEEHLNMLKDLIKKFDLKILEDIKVNLSTDNVYDIGRYTGKSIDIALEGKKGLQVDKQTMRSCYSGMSPSTIYSHEIIHALTTFAIENNRDFGTSQQIQELYSIYREALDVVTWEDFMPSNYDKNLQNVYEEHAKKIYDYIFGRSDNKGLAEFVAFGLTHENMSKKLKEAKRNIIQNKQKQKMSILHRLVGMVSSLFSILTTGNLSKNAKMFTEYMKGNVTLKSSKNLYSDLERLAVSINKANKEAANQFKFSPFRALTAIWDIFNSIAGKYNQILLDKLKYYANIKDIKFSPYQLNRRLTATKVDNIFDLIKSFPQLLVSKTARQAFVYVGRQLLNINQQSFILSSLRDILPYDTATNNLTELLARVKQVERHSANVKDTVYTNLYLGFGEDGISNEHAHALTDVILRTDLQSLLNDDMSNIDEVIDFLRDEKNIDESINKIEEELSKNTTKEQLNYYKNQVKFLAKYLAKGEGNESLNLNAYAIAEGVNSGSKSFTFDNNTVKNIDRLVSLYSLKLSDINNRQLASTLNKDGIKNFLTVQREFVKSNIEGVSTTDAYGNPSIFSLQSKYSAIKGYTKDIMDTTYETKVDYLFNRRKLEQEGWTYMETISLNDVTGKTSTAVFRRGWNRTNHRNGMGFVTSYSQKIGEDLITTAYQLARETNPDTSDIEPIMSAYLTAFKKKVYSNQKELTKQLLSKEFTMDEVMNHKSSGYIPVLDRKGMIKDFSLPINRSIKENIFNVETNALEILSSMYASQSREIDAYSRNKMICDVLLHDMKSNMNTSTNKGKVNGIRYIAFNKNTNNKFLQKAWSIIPNEVKEYAEKNKLYVREDWLDILTGSPSYSLADSDLVKKYAPVLAKKAIRIAEYMLQQVAHFSKNRILLKIPGVLYHNILGNWMYHISQGHNPLLTAKLTLDYMKLTKDYLDTEKEYNTIMFKDRLHQASKKELQLASILRQKMESNKISPLIKLGMYQSILQDSTINNAEQADKFFTVLNRNRFVKKIPNVLKKAGNLLYLNQGTAYYNFMNQLTEMSDFVSRCVEYELSMKKAPEKYTKDGKFNPKHAVYEAKVIHKIWSAFVNYDTPQSTLLQYMNDLGITAFTKYHFRINKAIAGLIKDKPLYALLTVLGQQIVDTDDIMEQNIFNKNMIFHNPLEEFTQLLIPAPIYWLNGKNTGL